MIIVALIIVGLAFGSFVNAFVWRWHQKQNKKLTTTERKKLSILHGRSMCPSCNHELKAKDLIPLFSWLWLRGKCRYCKQSISWQYPAVEFITAALFVASYLAWPFTDMNTAFWGLTIAWLLAVVIGLILAVYDFKWMQLPTKLIYGALLPLSLLIAGFHAWYELNWVVLGLALAGGAVGYGLFFVISHFSNGRLMGDGDVRLMLPLGIIAGGVVQTFATISIASFIAVAFILAIFASGKKVNRNTKIPFGPFLLAGAMVVFLWWPSIERLLLPPQ